MTREEVSNIALSYIDKRSKYIILELITGYGKTKLAIDLTNRISSMYPNPKILILVAKTVHKKTWTNEIAKWGGIASDNITIECYESFKKYKNTTFDILIADEMQHFSEARLRIFKSIKINHLFIGLSATIKKELKKYFRYTYNADFIKCGLKEAVMDDILPEPKVYLIPLTLDNKDYSYSIESFKRQIITTQKGYYDILSNKIEWYKSKYLNTKKLSIKNLWLSMAGKRLKWLSTIKEETVKYILKRLANQRTLTFCSSIEQCEKLGKYNITSKNKSSINNLELFNNNKIKHITACNILNEGVNLYNCKYGIFCNLNSSEIISKQRCGRLLRHKYPVIIIPYYIGTREEELVHKMLEEYSKESIIKLNSILDL